MKSVQYEKDMVEESKRGYEKACADLFDFDMQYAEARHLLLKSKAVMRRAYEKSCVALVNAEREAAANRKGE